MFLKKVQKQLYCLVHWCWTKWISIDKTKLDLNITPKKKISSKLITDLNLKPKTIKLLERENFGDLGLPKAFFNLKSKA